MSANDGDTRYASITGIRTDTVPWRLWEKAKSRAWNPAELDFTRDAKDWVDLDDAEQRWIGDLAAEFMVGEEAVTMHILPLLRAVADEGRLEEAMYLTTFAFDEARHVELFRRWFDAVGVERPSEDFRTPGYRRLFDDELPRVLRRLDDDRSPEAVLDAAVTYNQFVEGVLAITGYWAWHRVAAERDLFPGMRTGLQWVQRDERRHMAYGTFLCRRVVAQRPDLWSFVERRMTELQSLSVAIIQETSAPYAPAYPFGFAPDDAIAYAMTQFPRRLEVIEVARRERVEDVHVSTLEEDLEAELERL